MPRSGSARALGPRVSGQSAPKEKALVLIPESIGHHPLRGLDEDAHVVEAG